MKKPFKAALNRIILAGIAAATITTFSTAKASLVTFTYEGPVDSIGGPGYQVPSFNIGDPFQVTFTFESTTPNSGGDPTVGNYYALSSFSFSIGSYSGYLSSPLPSINVGNDYTGQGAPQDYYNIFGNPQGPTISGWRPVQFVFQLADPTATAFNSIALPLTPPDPADFVDPGFTYIGLTFEDSNGDFSEILTENLSPIPEPSIATLFCIGCGLFLLLRNAQKQKPVHTRFYRVVTTANSGRTN
jgi:hypothetical protein